MLEVAITSRLEYYHAYPTSNAQVPTPSTKDLAPYHARERGLGVLIMHDRLPCQLRLHVLPNLVQIGPVFGASEVHL